MPEKTLTEISRKDAEILKKDEELFKKNVEITKLMEENASMAKELENKGNKSCPGLVGCFMVVKDHRDN